MGLVLSIAVGEFALLVSAMLSFSIANKTSKASPCRSVNNSANMIAIISSLAFFIVLIITLFYA